MAEYDNDFDGTENGGTSTFVATGKIGTRVRDVNSDGDNELILFDGRSTSGILTLDLGIPAGQQTGEIQLEFDQFSIDPTTHADGYSVNFGTSLATNFENGVSTGLSINFKPLANVIQIKWNGTVIGSASLHSTGDGNITISVSTSGVVSVTNPVVTLSATIPSGEWQATDNTDWDFNIAGRTGDNAATISIDNLQVSAIVCFEGETKVETKNGLIRVRDLEVGDAVFTLDHGFQVIRWIWRTHVGADEIAANKKLAPVLIEAGSMGESVPNRDLWVSRQHRMLISSELVEDRFGHSEILVPAIVMTELDGISVDQVHGAIEYVHFIFDEHEIVLANGAPSESMLIASGSLSTLPQAAVDDLRARMPGAFNGLEQEPARPCRLLQPICRRVVKKHKRLKVPLVGNKFSQLSRKHQALEKC